MFKQAYYALNHKRKVFLCLAYESRIPLDEFKPKKILKIENH